jgi:hypothetical protein
MKDWNGKVRCFRNFGQPVIKPDYVFIFSGFYLTFAPPLGKIIDGLVKEALCFSSSGSL